MTSFFQYDNLSWDKVAELPRDTPLVLPLGSGHDLGLLASQLSDSPRVGLLPPFPFGWRGSGLELPDKIFAHYVFNLLDSLHDDGFFRFSRRAPRCPCDPCTTKDFVKR